MNRKKEDFKMFKCKMCKWLYDEPGAGIINYCGNDEITEEEHDRYRNKREDGCPYFWEIGEWRKNTLRS